MTKYVPKGWTYDEKYPTKPYHAQMSVNKRTQSIGFYATPEEAHAAYLEERKKHPRMPNRRLNWLKEG